LACTIAIIKQLQLYAIEVNLWYTVVIIQRRSAADLWL